MSLRKLAVAVVLFLTMSFVATAAPIVDVALVLMTDVSGSVDATDFDLMRTGYVNAFQSANLVNAIQGGTLGQIAARMPSKVSSPDSRILNSRSRTS